MTNKTSCGPLIPTNEMGVMYLFARYHETLGFEAPVRIGTRCPDGTFLKDGKEVRIEFEYLGINFVRHGHDPAKADLIVCWRNGVKSLPLPSLELAKILYVDLNEPIRRIERISLFGSLDILPRLYTSGPRTFTEIARAFDAGSGTVRANLNRLVKVGHVSRFSGPGAVHFKITPEGEKSIQAIIRARSLLKSEIENQAVERKPQSFDADVFKIRHYRPIGDFDVERVPAQRLYSFLDGRGALPEYANKEFKWIEAVVLYSKKVPVEIQRISPCLAPVDSDGKYILGADPPPVMIPSSQVNRPSPPWIPTTEQLERLKRDAMEWPLGYKEFPRRKS